MFESFILAGGKSSRMKRNKAFLKLDGKTLLDYSISTLRKIDSKKVSVVIAKHSEGFNKLSSEFPIISDIYENRGTLGGIYTALHNCKEKFAVILACDYPFVSKELLEFLIEQIENTKANCVAPLQKDEMIQPLCSVYNVEKCLGKITRILEQREKLPSTRFVLEDIKSHFVRFEEFANLPNAEHFFFNVNRLQDFEKALQIKKLLDEK